ncbi:MAG: glycosyltransferase family 4 protein [Nitrosopumilus sp.]|nr:glycosyltransferase family 4 protein [Nitrosopumilus sp.]
MKIAYFSPLSPIKSGISKYSEVNLLPYLQKFCEIDVIIDNDYTPSNEFVKNNLRVIPYKKFERHRYDVIFYHMGNSEYHTYIYNALLQYPGIVLLHDPFIGKFIANQTVAKNKPDLYFEHIIYCLGQKGKKIAENALSTGNWPSFEYTLTKRLNDSSLATIVHSDYAKKEILKESPHAFIKKMKMPIPLFESKKTAQKKDFGIDEKTLIISTMGYIAEHKRIHIVLDAFAKYSKKNTNSKFLLVGSFLHKQYKKEIEKIIKKLEIDDKVIQIGFVEDLEPYIQISDIVVQTRYPTAGETSIITLELMGASKPVIVSNTGWFKELPDEAVIKVNVDKDEQKAILDAFEKLTTDSKFKEEISINAKKYVKEKHNPEIIAEEFSEFLYQIQNKEQMKYLKEISLKLKDICIDESDQVYIGNFSSKIHEILS